MVWGFLGALWVGLAAGRGGAFDPPRAPSAGPGARRIEPAQVVVLDGDTYRVHGREVRLLGVDTPECAAPWFSGDQEPWAGRAAAFARERIARAGRAVLLSWGRRDRFERELVHLVLDGEPLAVALAEAGLAFPTVDRFGDGGFPGIAAQVRERAAACPFQEPWRWRRTHRRDVD